MTKLTGTTDPNLFNLLIQLRKQSNANEAPIWKEVARLLQRGRRRRITTNVSKISRVTQSDEVVLVPGKLLGAGEIDHPLVVSAWNFSVQAQRKIVEAGGQCLSLTEMIKKYPDGKNVRLMA